MPADQIARLEQTLDADGVPYRSELYEGAHHGYTQTDTAAYNSQGGQRHWRDLLELFGRRL